MERRKLLALALGTVGAATAVGVVGVSQAMTTTETATADPAAVEPAYGAGLFDVDPPQKNAGEDPSVVVVSEIDALPEDMEF